MFRATLFSAALILTGCSEFDLIGEQTPEPIPAPIIEVTPQQLLFGELVGGEAEVQTFTIQNIGDMALDVTDIELASGESFTILTEALDVTLEPGAKKHVDVEFSPLAANNNFGLVVVHSNDPETPEVNVDLMGEGAVPELLITPDYYDFENTFVPCGAEKELILTNIGRDDLVITELDYASGGHLSLLEGLELPLTLAPNDTAAVTVGFDAADTAGDLGTLAVTSNDPRGVVEAEQWGEGQWASQEGETFEVPVEPPVDIIFAVDQSCSMDTEAAALASAFGNFIGTINTVTTDWQVGVVTLFDGCFNSGVLDNSTPNYQSLFTSGVTMGGHHNRTEALLELSATAVSKTGAGQCNAGFLRPNALLHVIVDSDEPEQSGTNWSTWLNDMSAYVANPGLLKVSAVIDQGNCGTGSGGYVEAANDTGGEVLNICNSNWASQVDVLANASLAGINTFGLGLPAAGETVAVFVDGVEWTSGWTFDPGSNSVVFDDPNFQGGEIIDVDYAALSDCP